VTTTREADDGGSGSIDEAPNTARAFLRLAKDVVESEASAMAEPSRSG
jgi:hypothetical protein